MARLPDPYTNPAQAPGFSNVILTSNVPEMRHELNSGKVLSVQVASQFWDIKIQYPDLFPDEFQLIHSFILGTQAAKDNIEVVLPQYTNQISLANPNNMNVLAGYAGTTLDITNWKSVGASSLPKAGSLIKLRKDKKVYKVTPVAYDDLAFNGKVTLKIFPMLATTTIASDKVEFSVVPVSTKLVNSNVVEELNADGMYPGFSLNLRESL